MKRNDKSALVLTQSTAMGGQETQALYLAEFLAREGWTMSFCVPRDAQFDDLAEKAASFANVGRFDSDARHGRIHQFVELLRLWRFVRHNNPGVVHVHTGGATGGLAPAAVARLGWRRVVRTEHDVPRDRPDMKLRLSTALSDRLFHSVVAVSRRNARLRIARLGRQRNMAVVLNGVPLPQARLSSCEREELRSSLGFDVDHVVFGCVVRLAEGKGLDTLVDAFAMVVRTNPNVRLLLVGDGPMRAELESRAERLGIAGVVSFAGFWKEPGTLVQAMDAFVLAVPEGSMSIALLEAMALGLAPLITFGGPEEAVRDEECGLLATPNDACHLAKQMCRLAANRELRVSLSEAARTRVEQHYTSSRVATDYAAIYVSRAVPARLNATAPDDAFPGGVERTARVEAYQPV